MLELWNLVTNQVRDRAVGIGVAALFGFVGWYLGIWRARAKWKRREFFDRLNVSLNIVRDGKLCIRTILEKSCQEIFLNSAATETILAASKNTTADDPIIPLPKDEYWYFLNAILNEVAEKFSVGQVRRDLGQSVQSETYLVCLTNECSGELRTRKLRAMLIQKKSLLNLPKDQPALESPHHVTRWQTLQFLAKELAKNQHRFLEMEIVV